MYEIFEQLLKQNNVSAYRVAKDTGITTATLTSWKQGKYTPKQEKLQKLADYFGVTIDYLMEGKEKNSGEYYASPETAAMAQKLFENKELRVLFDAASDADPEDLEAVHTMLLALKRKERGSNDDTGC